MQNQKLQMSLGQGGPRMMLQGQQTPQGLHIGGVGMPPRMAAAPPPPPPYPGPPPPYPGSTTPQQQQPVQNQQQPQQQQPQVCRFHLY